MAKKETRFRVIMREAGWVTMAEAAWLAGVHAATIYRLADEGKLEDSRHGRFRFVSRASLARYYDAPPIVKRILEAELPEVGSDADLEDDPGDSSAPPLAVGGGGGS